ncbi:MAG TPA: flagellar filament capping protein FliD [Pirellulales bacterium]|jgi:flagellar hook-associated protein 2
MGTITSNIGLISGINYQQLVDQLIQVQSGTVNNQTAINKAFSDQQTAITSLEASLIALQFNTNKLSQTTLYNQRSTTSSDPSVLTASVNGDVQSGQYQVTSAQLAQNQQFQSSKFATNTSPLGAGTLTIGDGGFVNPGASLDLLNGGEGIVRGQIKITDRSGASATVDLRFATNVDDVLDAINNAGIGVQASTVGDQIKLVDTTGKTTSNLKVEEVSGGTTAASLGLSNISVAGTSATGSDVLQLFGDLSLNLLNDGNGVNFNGFLPDAQVTFRDGSTANIDFHQLNGATQEQTLNDVINTLNAAAPGKLHAAIDSSGNGLVLTDLTTDSGGTFSISALNGSKAVDDLGLNTTASGDTISGQRLLSGLKTVLLSDLNGGAGLGQLGSITITDRGNHSATVNLAGAQTLDDVTSAINSAGIGVTAQINDAGNGIKLVDTTGQSLHNFTITNADATNSADKLGLTVDSTSTTKSSGSLNLQTVSESTLLSSLNGGAGIGTGAFRITGTGGTSAVLTLGSTINTVGDLINAINVLGVGVTAQINSTGDGIALVDTAGGPSTLTVKATSGTAANDLHLLGGSQTVSIGGVPTQEINGSSTLSISLSSTDTLQDLVSKINSSGFKVQAAATNDGSAVKPYRLTLFNNTSGKAANLLVDTSGVGFSLSQTVAGQDAVAVLGSPNSPNSVVATSANNTFNSLLPGLSVSLQGTSTNPVTVTVGSTNDNLESTLQDIVDAYNKVQSLISQDTSFDISSNTAAVLQGDPTVLQVENDVNSLIAGSVFGNNSNINSLAQLGIVVAQDGTLQFDTSKFESVYSQNPDGVQSFLATKDTGLSDQFKKMIDSLAGPDASLLVQRAATLGQKIDDGQSRIDFLNSQLDSLRTRLLTQFQNSELAIAQIQSNLSAISAIQPFYNLGNNSNSSAAKPAQASTSSITG